MRGSKKGERSLSEQLADSKVKEQIRETKVEPTPEPQPVQQEIPLQTTTEMNHEDTVETPEPAPSTNHTYQDMSVQVTPVEKTVYTQPTQPTQNTQSQPNRTNQNPFGANNMNSGIGGILNLANHADGASGASAESLIGEITTYFKDKNTPSHFQMLNVSHSGLPNGSMVALYIIENNEAYVHPVLFAENGGRTKILASDIYQSSYGTPGYQNNQIKTTTAEIVMSADFREVMLDNINRDGNPNIRELTQIFLCGCTLIHEGTTIKPNNLIANASTDIVAAFAMYNNGKDMGSGPITNPHIAGVAKFANREMVSESSANPEKKTIHEQHVFAPNVLAAALRDNTTFSVGQGPEAKISNPIGEISGYFDCMPWPQTAQFQQPQPAQPFQNFKPIKPFFVITDVQWNNIDNKMICPENFLLMLAFIYDIISPSNWMPRVVAASSPNSGFNPLYNFASVGYDDPNLQGPIPDVNNPAEFNFSKQMIVANTLFSDMSILLDIPTAGPNAGVMNLLLNQNCFNIAMSNLLGKTAAFAGLGTSMGKVPLGTYSFNGKTRDVREVLNYLAWSTKHNGSQENRITYHNWMGPIRGTTEEYVLKQRVDMAGVMSGDTFSLTDVANRIDVAVEPIQAIRAMLGQNIHPVGAMNHLQGQYGYTGAYNSGFSMQSPVAGPGGFVNQQQVW